LKISSITTWFAAFSEVPSQTQHFLYSNLTVKPDSLEVDVVPIKSLSRDVVDLAPLTPTIPS
jgi:hypothetical protein